MREHSHEHWPLFTSVDDFRALGVTYRHRQDDGNAREERPLAPTVGTEVQIRVIYRCGACGRQAAQVEDFLAGTGERVIRFVGQVYSDSGPNFRGEADQQAGYVAYAHLQPSTDTAPQCMCPTHGALLVTVEEVEQDVFLSMQRESGGPARRDEAQRGTVTRKLSPGTPG